jgi:hypothetical protein
MAFERSTREFRPATDSSKSATDTRNALVGAGRLDPAEREGPLASPGVRNADPSRVIRAPLSERD